jgi:hypothetical protein
LDGVLYIDQDISWIHQFQQNYPSGYSVLASTPQVPVQFFCLPFKPLLPRLGRSLRIIIKFVKVYTIVEPFKLLQS